MPMLRCYSTLLLSPRVSQFAELPRPDTLPPLPDVGLPNTRCVLQFTPTPTRTASGGPSSRRAPRGLHSSCKAATRSGTAQCFPMGSWGSRGTTLARQAGCPLTAAMWQGATACGDPWPIPKTPVRTAAELRTAGGNVSERQRCSHVWFGAC